MDDGTADVLNDEEEKEKVQEEKKKKEQDGKEKNENEEKKLDEKDNKKKEEIKQCQKEGNEFKKINACAQEKVIEKENDNNKKEQEENQKKEKKEKKDIKENPNDLNTPNKPLNKEINNKNIKCFSFLSFFSHFLCLLIGLMVPICRDKVFHNDVINNKIIEDKNKIIIGLDFGSTQSGYQIFYDSKIDFEVDEAQSIITTELIFDLYFKKGLSIGIEAKNYPKENIELEKKLYFTKFKRNLDPKNKNNMANSTIPISSGIFLIKIISFDVKSLIPSTSDIHLQWTYGPAFLLSGFGGKFKSSTNVFPLLLIITTYLPPQIATQSSVRNKSSLFLKSRIPSKFLRTNHSRFFIRVI